MERPWGLESLEQCPAYRYDSEAGRLASEGQVRSGKSVVHGSLTCQGGLGLNSGAATS